MDPREPMHPQVRILFGALRAMRPIPVELTPAAQRAALDAFSEALNADAPKVAADEVMELAGVRVRVVRALVSAEAKPPALVYLHGGGWVLGSPEGYVKLTRQLAVVSGAVVISVDYRRAPEHPYPAALDDCEAVVRHVTEHGASLGIDTQRVAVGGDSAGGNLSAAVALRLGAHASSLLRGVLLYYPSLDHMEGVEETESYRRFAPDDPILPAPLKTFFRDCYVPRLADRASPFVSPVRGDLSTFPPTCLVVGTIDPLYSEGVAFARLLKERGREVELHEHAGMPHGFVQLPGFDDADRAIAESASFLRRVLSMGSAA